MIEGSRSGSGVILTDPDPGGPKTSATLVQICQFGLGKVSMEQKKFKAKASILLTNMGKMAMVNTLKSLKHNKLTNEYLKTSKQQRN
jgi:hypothetical protein